MRIAIISDIHSNYIALQAVMDNISEQQVDKTVCLGDVVGYGPSPNECVDLIRERTEFCLMGNHDWAVLGRENLENFNPYAREAVLFTRKLLTQESIEFLQSLPFTHIEDDITYVHSSPFNPEYWTYISGIYDAKYQFEHFKTPVCFVGHTHVAGAFVKKDSSFDLITWVDSIQLEDNAKYIINVGSVGQPRDFDPRACYGIVDLQKKQFEYHRFHYDIESTQTEMEKYGLPRFLIDRLSVGR